MGYGTKALLLPAGQLLLRGVVFVLLRRCRRIVVIIKGLFTMRFSIRVDLFHQFFCIVPDSCWDLFLYLLLRIGVGLDVCSVDEDGLGRQIGQELIGGVRSFCCLLFVVFISVFLHDLP